MTNHTQATVEEVAQEIWFSEYLRATGKVRNTPWDEAVSDEDKDRYRFIARRILALPSVGWRTIDSAPKDGTDIDVWVGGEFPGRRTDVQWREPTDSEWWVHGGDTIETPDATWHDAFGPLGKSEQPTHWKPLDPPPQPVEDR